MSNFKEGDFVVCVNNTRYPNQIKAGVPKIVHSISLGGKYLRVQRDDRPEIGGYEAEDFVLSTYFADDDPLPPAPESVRYYHSSYHGVHEDAYLNIYSGRFSSGPRIRIADKDNRGITIDADTALQLAHDLRRMAMDIKRKEKQNG